MKHWLDCRIDTWWEKAKDTRLWEILFKSDLDALRLTLGLGGILTGLGFLWPYFVMAYVSILEMVLCAELAVAIPWIFPTDAQIAAGKGRHTYIIMAHIAREWVWGSVFLLQGIVMTYCLLKRYHSKVMLWCDAVLGAAVWCTAVWSCYAAYWVGFGAVLGYRPPAIMGMEWAGAIMSLLIVIRYSVPKNKDLNG